MTTDVFTVAGFILAVFIAGVAVGRFAEKIERFISKEDDQEHKCKK